MWLFIMQVNVQDPEPLTAPLTDNLIDFTDPIPVVSSALKQ